MERLLRTLVHPFSGAVVFALAIVGLYGIGTWTTGLTMRPETTTDMALLPWVSATCVVLGSLFFQRQAPQEFQEKRAEVIVYGVTFVFLTFCATTILSAASIPLLQALHGASPEAIAVAREEFLKARTGWAAILPYVNGLLTATILPYCMCIALLHKYRYRWWIVASFFLYSMVFVEKAFFLRIVLPLMAVVVVSGTKRVRLTWLLAAAIGLLLLNIVISGFAESTGSTVGGFLIFRAFAVPVSTVTDSLDYWWKNYHGQSFLGATNLLLSSLFGLKRIQFERDVFEYEWGASTTGTGSSNAAYFVEAYVNFGLPGVIVFSLMLGALISYIGRSKDVALRCILPLVLYSVFLGGLMSLFFGNGLIVCLLLSAYLNRRPRAKAAEAPDESPDASNAPPPMNESPEHDDKDASMRLLIVSQYFHPESFRINTLCQDLAERGHSVTVLTGQPNYPSGKIAPGYRAWSFQREQFGNVEVVRMPLYPRKRGSAIHLVLNYLSFVASGILFGPWLLRGKRVDSIFVYAISPLLQALPAIVLKWIKGAKLVVWVQDLWPEAMEATGFVKNRWVLSATSMVVRFIYRCSDSVLVQSDGFVEPVARLCARDKIAVFPNSAEAVFLRDGLSTPSPIPQLGEGFSAVFAGNLGTVQALPTILDAAEKLRAYPEIRIFLVGTGTLADELRENIARRELHNVVMSGHFPIEQMPAILSRASVLLVTLKDVALGRFTVPSKIQAYLATGRPIIAALNGEGARIVKAAGAGLSCPSENATMLAECILAVYQMTSDEREALGRSGRAFFEMHYEQGVLNEWLISHFAALSKC
jgi:oligosaccharide repeat unit polymerase